MEDINISKTKCNGYAVCGPGGDPKAFFKTLSLAEAYGRSLEIEFTIEEVRLQFQSR